MTSAKKKAVWAVVAVLVLWALWRVFSQIQAQRQANAPAATTKAEAVVELRQNDVASVSVRELMQELPVSGSIKAVNSAQIKARVAGELQGLSLREGDSVQLGQVLARIDPTEYVAKLKQAQEQAAAAKAQIDIAQRQYDNNKALVDQGFISKTALDSSEANLRGAQATHLAARAAVEVAQKALDDSVLRAPIAGQVSQRLAQPGERVAIDGKVLEIVDISRLELEATLAAADATAVRVGQSARLQIDGLPQPLAAQVVRINPSTQAGGRSLLVYLSLPRQAGLRQGLFAQGQIAVGKASGLSVPVDAIRTERPEPYVQVVENQHVVHRPVQVGARSMAQTEAMAVITGVPAGAQVLRGDVGPLRAGTAIEFGAGATAPVAGSASATAATAKGG